MTVTGDVPAPEPPRQPIDVRTFTCTPEVGVDGAPVQESLRFTGISYPRGADRNDGEMLGSDEIDRLSLANVPIMIDHGLGEGEPKCQVGRVLRSSRDGTDKLGVEADLDLKTAAGRRARDLILAGGYLDLSIHYDAYQDEATSKFHGKKVKEVSITVRGRQPGCHIKKVEHRRGSNLKVVTYKNSAGAGGGRSEPSLTELVDPDTETPYSVPVTVRYSNTPTMSAPDATPIPTPTPAAEPAAVESTPTPAAAAAATGAAPSDLEAMQRAVAEEIKKQLLSTASTTTAEKRKVADPPAAAAAAAAEGSDESKGKQPKTEAAATPSASAAANGRVEIDAAQLKHLLETVATLQPLAAAENKRQHDERLAQQQNTIALLTSALPDTQRAEAEEIARSAFPLVGPPSAGALKVVSVANSLIASIRVKEEELASVKSEHAAQFQAQAQAQAQAQSWTPQVALQSHHDRMQPAADPYAFMNAGSYAPIQGAPAAPPAAPAVGALPSANAGDPSQERLAQLAAADAAAIAARQHLQPNMVIEGQEGFHTLNPALYTSLFGQADNAQEGMGVTDLPPMSNLRGSNAPEGLDMETYKGFRGASTNKSGVMGTDYISDGPPMTSGYGPDAHASYVESVMSGFPQ